MKATKENNLYRLFLVLNKRRKNQIYFLFFLLIINGISESIATLSIVPYLSLIISNRNQANYDFINKYLPIDVINSANILLYFTILFCSFIFISTCIRIFNNWYILRLTAKINIDLSNSIFNNNIYQSYLDYTKKSSSKTIDLLTDKIRLAVASLKELFNMLLGLIIGLFIIISLLIYSWQIIIVSFLFLYIFYFFISNQVKKTLIRIGRYIAMNSPLRIKIVQESFNGFKDIVINGTENIYFNLFDKYNSSQIFKEAKSQFFIVLPKFLLEGIVLFTVAIVGYSVSSTNNQNSDLLPLLGAFIYSLQRLLPLSQLTYSAWAGYNLKSSSITEVLKAIENKPNIISFIPNQKKLKFTNEINFNQVTYFYSSTKNILKEVNLSIKKGDHIGIYGETGSGKSTFLDLLMGLLPPKEGYITIDNIDINNNNNKISWISNISHVPQSIFLKEGNIAENIAFGQTMEDLDFDLLVKSSRTAQIYEFIKKNENEFFTLVGERGIRLSGGQRQRIAIARALYKSREILVLDEATSALDEYTEKKIIDNILETYEKLTIIMVTHRLNSLKNCNRVFRVTSSGEVIEE